MQKKILSALVLCLTAVTAMAGELDDILDKHWEAQGGKKALEAIKTMVIKGNMSITTPQGQMDFPLKMTMKDGNKARFDATLQGMDMVQCVNGESGWKIVPFMGSTDPEDMTDIELKEMKRRADFLGDLYNYKEKGNKVELVGKADVEGTETFHITSTDPDGKVTNHYIDTENYILIKTQGKENQNGMEIETETFYSDYKEVGDLMMAHALTMKAQAGMAQGMEMRYESVEVNSDVPDDVFKKPEPKEEKKQ